MRVTTVEAVEAYLRTESCHYAAVMDDDVVDRIERAFAAAVQAHAVPIRLEVTSAQYRELAASTRRERAG
jgi:hypothetical protein